MRCWRLLTSVQCRVAVLYSRKGAPESTQKCPSLHNETESWYCAVKIAFRGIFTAVRFMCDKSD